MAIVAEGKYINGDIREEDEHEKHELGPIKPIFDFKYYTESIKSTFNIVNVNPIVEDQKNSRMYMITECPHRDRKYYARGMCKSCYNAYGKVNYATECAHSNKMVYALKKCQKCYSKDRYSSRQKL